MEIVPPKQRIWYSSMSSWVFNILNLIMWLMINGRFDDTLHIGGYKVTGEQAIYWFGAAATAAGFIFVLFFVRERKPDVPVERPTAHGNPVKGVLRSLLAERALWPVYLLAFSGVLVTTGLGALDGLLTTEQWGYSKQDFATNVFVGGMLNIAILPLIGWGLNRTGPLNGYLIGVAGTLILKIAYYVYVTWFLPDQRPSVTDMILFGYPTSLFATIMTITVGPLVFDYIPRDKMGTAQAGLGVVRNITRLITLNGVGLWVAWYSGFTRTDGSFDYFSGYLFMILMNILGCGILIYFARQVRRGVILPLGRTDFHPVEDTSPPSPATEGRA
jgi:hypothetical protein